MSEPVSDPDKAAQDAAWQEIVANFGDRAALSDDELTDDELTMPVIEPLFDDDVDEHFEPDEERYEDSYDHDAFVAPRPALPRPTPDRLFAWLGALGAPVVAVALFVLHATFGWWIPNWVVDVLVIAFLAGFGYLVFHMPREPRDPWDDGARL